MTHILKMFQFLNKYRMTKMQVRSCRVKAGLDLEGNPGFLGSLELFSQFIPGDNVYCASGQQGELFVYSPAHFAYSTDLVSLITVTLIWPG